jgi:ATP-binding cassette subfamily B protein
MTDDTSELLKSPFWYYLKKHRRTAALGLTWLFLTNSFETTVPWLVGKTLDRITAERPLEDVLELVGVIFGVILFLSLFRYLWRVYWAGFHHTVAQDLRDRAYNRMALLGPSFFRTRKIGELISLISNDVNSFRMGIGPGLLVIFDGCFLAALILPMMFSISWKWTLQTLVLMPFVPFVVRWILGRLHARYHARQNRFAEVSGSAQEIISGIRTIKSFAQERNQTTQFNVHSDVFRQACDRVSVWDALFGPALELPVALGSVLLLLLGAPEVMSGAVTLGSFFAFYQYIQRMVWPMSAIGIGLGQVKEAQAAFRRVQDVLVFQPDVPDEGDVDLEALESLEVRGLSFTYPGASLPALENVSFILRQGECMGVVGMTGSGKSTLVELLTRQYLAPRGTIWINGLPIERVRLSSLRRLIGVVPQEPFLFSRQVAENLALGLDDWDMDIVREAAGHVRLDAEIESWPGAYEALVGERGVNLSGGQKQRMTLARAMIRSAPFVILDDCLSAVDAKTEAAILHQLHDDLKRTTSIVISHRLASVRDADQILILHGGRVEALGRHEELIRTSGTYQTLNEMQSTEGH